MTALLSVPLFKGMTAAELNRLEARSRIIEPRDGSRVFAEGDPSDAVYAIDILVELATYALAQ